MGFAQETKVNAYEDYHSIPSALRAGIRQGAFREQYISNHLSVIRKNGDDKNQISQKNINDIEEYSALDARKRQVSNIIKYDENLDGIVSLDEVKQSIVRQNPNVSDGQNYSYINNIVQSLFDVDRNNDWVITRDEMSEIDDQTLKNIKEKSSSQLTRYIALDPDQNNMLTIDELEVLARKAFSTVDLDNDSIVSEDEMALYQEAISSFFEVPEYCKAPRIQKNTKLVGIEIGHSNSLSSVTASNQDFVTTAVKVALEENMDKTYLVLSGRGGMIWQLSGNVDAVEHLVILDREEGTKFSSYSGATGLPKEKVTFIKSDCIPGFLAREKPNSKAKFALEKIVGKSPEILEFNARVNSVSINQDGVDFKTGKLDSQNKAPKGFSELLWPTVLFYHPGGIEKINPKEVVAENTVSDYDVLPRIAGIAQLVGDGSAEIVGDGEEDKIISFDVETEQVITRPVRGYYIFRIVKNIPRYPAGLNVGFAAKFIIAEGVAPPLGNPGISCVVLENTGEIIHNSPSQGCK